jgi:hypothetical protein
MLVLLLSWQCVLPTFIYGQVPAPQPPITTPPTPAEPSWLQFSGKSRITSGSETPQPTTSGLPNDYARWEFEPSLAIYEVPIAARVLLTTENDPTRSAMNSVEIMFDVKAFQKMLRDKIMEKAAATATDFKAKAEEMKSKLADPSVAADLAQYDSLKSANSTQALTGKAKEQFDALQSKTADARAMAATAARYANLNPEQEAREKQKELSSLSREIADPNKLEDKLKEMDLFSGAEKAFFGLKELGVGVTYPSYSPLVLAGVPVNGATIDYQYGILCIGASDGSMGAPIPIGRTISQTYKRNSFAAKLGLGSSEGTHLHFLGLYAGDNTSTATPDSAYTPEKNYVGAVDGRLDLFSHAISLTGTIAGSMLTQDETAPGISSFNAGNPTASSIVMKLGPNLSTSADYAWNVASEFNLFDGQTEAKASAQMIGPGYMTLGVPYLRTDLLGKAAELNQSLFKGQFTLSGYYKENADDIIPWKRVLVGTEYQPARTTLTSYGGSFGLQPRDLPYLKVEYSPFLQQTAIDSVDTMATDQTTLLSIVSGYDYPMFGGMGTTTALAILQVGTSNDGTYNFANNNFMLNQTFSDTSGRTFTLGANYSTLDLLNVITETKGVTASSTFELTKTWKGTLALDYTNRTDGSNRFGFSIRTSLKLSEYHDLEFRAERNAYQGAGPLDPGYTQLNFRMVLSSKW